MLLARRLDDADGVAAVDAVVDAAVDAVVDDEGFEVVDEDDEDKQEEADGVLDARRAFDVAVLARLRPLLPFAVAVPFALACAEGAGRVVTFVACLVACFIVGDAFAAFLCLGAAVVAGLSLGPALLSPLWIGMTIGDGAACC